MGLALFCDIANQKYVVEQITLLYILCNLSKQQQTTYHNSFADEGDAGVEHEEGRTVDTVHDSLQQRLDRGHHLHDANGPKAGFNVHVNVARPNLET